MNTANIKKYAPLARNAFITAVTKRANELGIYASHIEAAREEGQTLIIEGRSVALKLKGARQKLITRVENTGFNQLMEHIAYTWFNRLCAIRFMELHDYLEHGLRVLSPSPSQGEGWGEGGLPEILNHAQDVAEDLGLNREQIIELKLAGNQDELLYRTILLGQCHALHKAMPFLFEAIDDETELLLPDNLTRTDSILRGLVDDIPAEDWEQVEIIGWLYQFYISEKKDAVIGSVVKSEDIPAATQLFTPNWIVKYLVQNSIGRQWLQSYPDSSIKAGMEYYIEPAQQTKAVAAALAANTPDSIDPEQLKVLDPACGSGHILVEAYQLLKAIYAERGYQPRKIPQLILENNLYGLDIDDRAAQLAGFALMMCARADDRRIFTRDIQLNVMALQASQQLVFDELWQKLDLNKQSKIGTTSSIFNNEQIELSEVIDDNEYQTLKALLSLFEKADTFGSLIQIPEQLTSAIFPLLKQLKELAQHGDSFQKPTASQLIPFIQQAQILAQQYDAVIANPPYMGGKGMNPDLKAFAKQHYPDSKSDLFAMFIERGFDWLNEAGFNAMVTMQSWMFLSSYEKMRENLLDNYTIENMTHMGNGVMKIAFGTNATIFRNIHLNNYQGFYSYVENADVNAEGVPFEFPVQNERLKTASADDFKKIPASPIAYWLNNKIIKQFSGGEYLGKKYSAITGLSTTDSDYYLRIWSEVNYDNSKFDCANATECIESKVRWFPINKGGNSRRWYGNNDTVLSWYQNGIELKEFLVKKYNGGSYTKDIRGEQFYFHDTVAASAISSGINGFRWYPTGGIFDVNFRSFMPANKEERNFLLAFLNSKVVQFLLNALSPTIALNSSDLSKLPITDFNKEFWEEVDGMMFIAKIDWNTYEISWDFQQNPLIVGWVSDSVTQHIEVTAVGLRDKAANPTYNKAVSSFPRSSVGMQTAHDKNTVGIPTEDAGNETLSDCYANWQQQNQASIAEMQRLEQENNRLFIDAYGLQDELTPDVPLEQITLTVNPKYRYGGKLSDEALAQRFQSDTLAELISYFIGCLMGRYRLDKAGLIYAHAGNIDFANIYNAPDSVGWVSDSVTQHIEAENVGLRDKAANPTYGTEQHDAERGNELNPFIADDDGIIPLTDQEWFADDATHRFREFVRVVWGEDHLQQNLDFVAESLCLYAIKPKSSESSLATIRRYLSTQFYKDHLKTYKKRPIYWLFSSGKQKAFECLVYLHRYNESTLSRMRTEYVTPLLGKYEASAIVLQKQIEAASSTSDANRFKKSLTALEKKQTELSEFDDKLKHYADMRISLDLDDGVKVNYGKFGDLLVDVKAITGKK